MVDLNTCQILMEVVFKNLNYPATSITWNLLQKVGCKLQSSQYLIWAGNAIFAISDN